MSEDRYVYPSDRLAWGASLGNRQAWVNGKATGAIEGLWSNEVGVMAAGSLAVHFFDPDGGRLDNAPDAQARFAFLPAGQRRVYALANGLQVEETLFLPDELAQVYLLIHLTNPGVKARAVTVAVAAHLTGATDADLLAHYLPHEQAILAHNAGRPHWARRLAAMTHNTHAPFRCCLSPDAEATLAPILGGSHTASGDVYAALQTAFQLPGGATETVSVSLAFSPHGEEAVRRIPHQPVADWQEATHFYRELDAAAHVATPDRRLNEGVHWAKVNTHRVWAHYPTGEAFTNNPGCSVAVVGRDVAWYLHGSDWFLPEAGCAMLRKLAELQYPDGKILEYYDARDDTVHDYGLNINDNTPLFLLACAHHAKTTGHAACLESLYPAMRRAADYLLSQRDARGLVFCTSTAHAERGICGWRNIIGGRQISGAVTEINAECVAGLRALADCAAHLGNKQEARQYAKEAETLHAAINEHLRNPANGLYLLNIAPDGTPITHVTADAVFPVLFDIADEPTAARILDRLAEPDFLTSVGLRTMPSTSLLYSPDQKIGLEGGVWPGMTWWYAMAARKHGRTILADWLAKSYAYVLENPRANNTVPGQFVEWMDGESHVSRGMRLSPWEPPRYVWAAVEGALGIEPMWGAPRVVPCLPPEWTWAAVRDLLYHGAPLSLFIARTEEGLRLFSNRAVESPHSVAFVGEDISALAHTDAPDTALLLLRGADEVALCVGSAQNEARAVTLHIAREAFSRPPRIAELLGAARAEMETDSRRHGTLTLRIAAQGYAVARFA